MVEILHGPTNPQDATTKQWVEENTTNAIVRVFASEPAPALVEGDQFWPLDGVFLEIMASGAWRPFGPTRALTKPPAASGFTSDNFGASVIDETRGGIRLTTGAPSASLRAKYKAKLFTAPWTLEAAFLTHGQINNAGESGIFIRDSAGKIMTCAFTQNGNFRVDKWTSATAFSTNAKADSMGLGIPFCPHWVRIRDNGTDIFFDFSYDLGTNWLNRWKEARGAFFTAGPGPTQVGFYANDANSAGGLADSAVSMWLYHWREFAG